MSFVGMDVEVVTKVSADLKAQADKLDSIVTTVDKLVSRAKGTWHGRDAERLFALWQGSARSVLRGLSADVNGLADKARSNAAEQTQASENYGSDGVLWSDTQRFLAADNIGWGIYEQIDKGFTYGGMADTVGHLISTRFVYSKGILTFPTSIAAGDGLFEEVISKVHAGPLDRILGPVGIGLGAVDTFRDFSKGDYVGSYLDYAGTALGVAGLIVGMATPVGLGVAVGGLAVAGLSIGWNALPKSFTSAVNGQIALGANEVGHAAAAFATDVWNADVAEVKGAVHVVSDVVDAGVKAANAVANEGSKVLKTILKKPSWVPW